MLKTTVWVVVAALAMAWVPLAAAQDEPASPPPTHPEGPSVPSPDSSLYGLNVREIRLQGAHPEQADRLLQRVVQKLNEPLDRVRVRQSIQALYSTGLFADIRARVERVSDQDLSLVFVATERFFIGSLTLEGAPKPAPSVNQLLSAGKLQLGELLTEERLHAAIDRMQKLMQENGFYRSSITAVQTQHRETQLADVHFKVAPGEPASVGEVAVQGMPGFSQAEALRIAKLHPGDRVTARRLTGALERLRKKYQKQNRLLAEVSLTERTYRPATNSVDYVFVIERGPRVDVQVEGAGLSRSLIKRHIPVYEENAVDDDLLNEGRRNLRDYFQTQGYFNAKVGFRQESDAASDRRRVIYEVERGPRHKLTEILISGNRYFPEDLIRERLLMQESGWLFSHGRFSQATLARDIQSILDLYRSNGFPQVKVTGEVEEHLPQKDDRIRVHLRIEEGSQARVAALVITGNGALTADQILGVINTTEGQPYSPANIEGDRDAVLNLYFNEGFPEATFQASAEPDPADPSRMNVAFRIQEGQQVFVDHIVFSGLKHTRPYVVKREFQIREGDPLSLSDILETQRRLYDLGLFNQVNLAVQNPDGRARRKNLVLQVEEAKRYTFNYGFGFEVQSGGDLDSTQPQSRTGVSPRVSFEVTRINFRGRDHTLVFKSRLGRLQQRALLGYIGPRWFNKENLRFSFTAFFDTTRDVRTFTAERLEGAVQAEHTWSKATTFLYRFAYRRVKVDPATLAIDPQLIPLLSKPVRVGIPSFTWIRDTRDDPIDSTKGTFATLDLGVSSGIFGSESSFWRMFFQHTTYHPLSNRKIILARTTRLGLEQPFDREDTVIPLPELFFGGGGNSHRGFAINQAGPRDRETGFPVGGEAVFLNSLELRFPPVLLPVLRERVGAVLFHDAGNVFSTSADLFRNFFRTSQKSESDCRLLTLTARCDFNYLSHAIGAGLRYQTPIGPVRVDFGYNLNPPTFPVREAGRSETLKHFNIFFSIGQTF